MRRVIVRATNPSKRTIEVAVLSNNPDMDMQRIVTLIFNRWIQENNFQYLDRHFGLLQITSYASENYKDIAHTLVDRLVDSKEYRELKKKFAAVEQTLQKLLLKRERKSTELTATQNEENVLNQSLAGVEKKIETLRETLKFPRQSRKLKQLELQLREFRTKHKRTKAKIQKLQDLLSCLGQQITEKTLCLEHLDTDLETTLRKQSRIKILVKDGYQRPNIRKKSMMDALRIVAHNMFQNMINIFRPIYGNYRNDHVMMRALTRTDGFIWRSDRVIYIRFWLRGRQQQHTKERIHQFVKHMENFINAHFRERADTVNIGIVSTTKEIFSINNNHGVQVVTPSSLEE